MQVAINVPRFAALLDTSTLTGLAGARGIADLGIFINKQVAVTQRQPYH